MTSPAALGYQQMAQVHAAPWSWSEWDSDERGRERIKGLAELARTAVGRLGTRLDPHLDEGLVVGRSMMMLMQICTEMTAARAHATEQAARATVEGLRAWVKSGPWFEGAWRDRVGPLCSAAGHCGVEVDELIADRLSCDPAQVADRFLEAGLVFGVSPERILPLARVNDSAREQVSAIVGALPECQRTILTFYFRERLSFPEIAELLSLSPEQLQVTYGRAAILIRSRLLAAQAGDLYGDILGGGLRTGA